MIKKYIKSVRFGLIAILTALTSVTPLLLAYLIQNLVDIYINKKVVLDSKIYSIVMAIVIMFILKLLLINLRENFLSDIRLDLSEKAFRGMIKKDAMNYLNRESEGVYTPQNLVANYVEQILDDHIRGILSIVEITFSTIYAFIYAVSIHFTIAIYAGIFMVLLYFINKNGSKLISKYRMKLLDATNAYQTHIANIIANYFNIKQYGLREYIRLRLDAKDKDYYQSYVDVQTIFSKYSTATAIIYVVQKLGIIIIGIVLYSKAFISEGQLLAVTMISTTLSQPLINLGSSIRRIESVKEIKASVEELCEDSPKTRTAEGSHDGASLKKFTLRLQEGDYPVELDLGKRYLLIGRNGVGKSTMLKDIVKELYGEEKIGFVIQNAPLLDGSLEENIVFFGPKEEGKIEKLKSEFHLDLPNERSCEDFSGGEKQKVQLIRTFYSDPSFVVFDEAFSKIGKDEGTLLLKRALGKIDGGIVVTHHLAPQDLDLFDHVILHLGDSIQISKNDEEKRGYYEKYIQRQ